jgi:predicted nuclease of predicted toxin-antitoxin system
MNFKLDENFGKRTVRLFMESGHNVRTVHDEGLSGIDDDRLFEVCCSEERCLVSLDLDFADTLRFDSARCAGIAVIRIPMNPGIELLEAMIKYFLNTLNTISIEGRLWIVEPGRIRVHQIDEDE